VDSLNFEGVNLATSLQVSVLKTVIQQLLNLF